MNLRQGVVMLSKLRRRLASPFTATAIAFAALFVALGGTGAFALDGRNSVDSGDILNHAVQPRDLAEGLIDLQVQIQDVTVPAGTTFQATVNCDDGLATGGGFAGGSLLVVQDSLPAPANQGDTPTGWTVRLRNPTSQASAGSEYVVCTQG